MKASSGVAGLRYGPAETVEIGGSGTSPASRWTERRCAGELSWQGLCRRVLARGTFSRRGAVAGRTAERPKRPQLVIRRHRRERGFLGETPSVGTTTNPPSASKNGKKDDPEGGVHAGRGSSEANRTKVVRHMCIEPTATDRAVPAKGVLGRLKRILWSPTGEDCAPARRARTVSCGSGSCCQRGRSGGAPRARQQDLLSFVRCSTNHSRPNAVHGDLLQA